MNNNEIETTSIDNNETAPRPARGWHTRAGFADRARENAERRAKAAHAEWQRNEERKLLRTKIEHDAQDRYDMIVILCTELNIDYTPPRPGADETLPQYIEDRDAFLELLARELTDRREKMREVTETLSKIQEDTTLDQTTGELTALPTEPEKDLSTTTIKETIGETKVDAAYSTPPTFISKLRQGKRDKERNRRLEMKISGNSYMTGAFIPRVRKVKHSRGKSGHTGAQADPRREWRREQRRLVDK